MATSKKIVTTIRINDNIREKLREQAHKVGMDVSNYIAYLVMYKEEKEKQEAKAKEITIEFLKAISNGNPEVLDLVRKLTNAERSESW